jgi:hypothetical protein
MAAENRNSFVKAAVLHLNVALSELKDVENAIGTEEYEAAVTRLRAAEARLQSLRDRLEPACEEMRQEEAGEP